MPTLAGARVLVVGASAGIGRSLARHAVAHGAHVCVSARRADRLEALCGEMGGGHPIAGDVTDPDTCHRVVSGAADRLGGLDLVVYTAGSGTLAPVAGTDAADWRRIYDVNVVGPMLVTAAALPVLAADGVITFLSSEAPEHVRWGLGAYAASKSALDTAIRYLRHEHPERRFQRVVMGATMPTEFGDGFSADMLDLAFRRWSATGPTSGPIPTAVMETDDVAGELAELLAIALAHPAVEVPDLRFAPRGEPWPDA